ncbi:hypothetical protein [Klebsiella phage pKP-BM327-1.2]|nr:hypothetical protein [Klebsiella phage pKP-BM327-1.2]
MSKIIYVYAPAVQKCIHIRVTDVWLKKVKMALAIGCTLDGYCIDGSRIKRKNQRNISSSRADTDEMFKGYDVFLNKNGVWEFKKYVPKPSYFRQLGKTATIGSHYNNFQNLPKV